MMPLNELIEKLVYCNKVGEKNSDEKSGSVDSECFIALANTSYVWQITKIIGLTLYTHSHTHQHILYNENKELRPQMR